MENFASKKLVTIIVTVIANVVIYALKHFGLELDEGQTAEISAALLTLAGIVYLLVQGRVDNTKVKTTADLRMQEFMLSQPGERTLKK